MKPEFVHPRDVQELKDGENCNVFGEHPRPCSHLLFLCNVYILISLNEGIWYGLFSLHLFTARAVIQSKSSRPSVPISNATKRSFLASPGMADSAHPVPNSPEVCNRYFLHTEESDPL